MQSIPRLHSSHSREVSGGALGLEDGLELLLRRLGHAVGQGELDLSAEELLHMGAAHGGGGGSLSSLDGVLLGCALARRHDAGVHDVDGREADAMATGKLVVHLLHGIAQVRGTEFLVHVVGAASGVVADRDAVVLDGRRLALADLVN